jgi:hypothetical protein
MTSTHTMQKIERITPQGMQANSPTVEESSSKESFSGKEKVESRVENTREGYCPVCNVQMSPSEANGNSVLACFSHGIVMPVRD